MIMLAQLAVFWFTLQANAPKNLYATPATQLLPIQSEPAFFLAEYDDYRSRQPIALPEKTRPSTFMMLLDRLQLCQANGHAYEDPLLNGYLRGLLARIYPCEEKSRSASEKFDIQLCLLRDKEFNAYATGHRLFVVKEGLFLSPISESTILCVMGHELGHLRAHHIENAILREELDSSQRRFDAAVFWIPIVNLYQLGERYAKIFSHSQQNELQADALGVILAHNAGINPRSFYEFLEHVLRKETTNEWSVSSENEGRTKAQIEESHNWFSTHPTNVARLTALERQIAKLPTQQHTSCNSAEFWLAKARFLSLDSRCTEISLKKTLDHVVQSEGSADTSEDQSKDQEAAFAYGKALLDYKNKNYSRAEQSLSEFVTLRGGESLWSIELSAKLKLAQQQSITKEWAQLKSRWQQLKSCQKSRSRLECLTLALILGSLAQETDQPTLAIQYFEFAVYLDPLNLFSWKRLEKLYPTFSSRSLEASARIHYLVNSQDPELRTALTCLRRAVEAAEAEKDLERKKALQKWVEAWLVEAKAYADYAKHFN